MCSISIMVLIYKQVKINFLFWFIRFIFTHLVCLLFACIGICVCSCSCAFAYISQAVFHVLQKHGHSQKVLKPGCYYAGRQLWSTDLEVWHCCSATMQTLFLCIWEGSKECWRQLLLLSTHQRISESYHHLLLDLLSSLCLRKPEGKAGTQQDEPSRLTCLLSPPLPLEEFLPWVAGWHCCLKQAPTYTDVHSAFRLLGYLVLRRKRFCRDAIITHLLRPLLLSSRIWQPLARRGKRLWAEVRPLLTHP